MGISEAPVEAPDTYGIPEYRVSEMRIETDGHDVRMVLGTKRFGQIYWLYTVVIHPENLLRFSRECGSVSERMVNLEQIIAGRTAH
jgi:hypothetical protein